MNNKGKTHIEFFEMKNISVGYDEIFNSSFQIIDESLWIFQFKI